MEPKRLLTKSIGAVLLCASVASAEVPSTCGTGTLRNVEAVTRTFPSHSHTRVVTKITKNGDREASADTSSFEQHDTTYFVTVELDDMSYTAQSAGNFWNFNPTRLVINDSIGICVERKHIILRRPDGKDYKASIVGVVRTPGRS